MNLWRHLVGRSIEVCPPSFDSYVAEGVTNISLLSFYYKLKIINSFNSGNIILARSLFGKALNSGVVDAETLLIYSSVHESSSVRLSWINIALARYGLPSVSLDNRCSSSDYGLLDNLLCSLRKINSSHKVSIIIAAYNCGDHLRTCLRSLQNQLGQTLNV